MTMSTLSNNTSTESLQATGLLRNILLCFCVTFSLSGNLFIIISICRSKTLRKKAVYRLVISCAISNLFDVFFNLPIVLGLSLLGEKFEYGFDFACPFNAFFVQLVDSSVLYNLMLLSIERAFAVHTSKKRKISCNVAGQAFGLLIIWITSFVMALPVTVSKNVPAMIYVDRFSCSSGRLASIGYSISLCIISFLIPFSTTLFIYISILIVGFREHYKRKQLKLQQDYMPGTLPKPPVWGELNMSKFTGVLLIGWIVLVGPYRILVIIDSIKNSKEYTLENGESYDIDSTVDTVLLWLRHFYGVWLPIISISMKRKLRRKCCCGQLTDDYIRNGDINTPNTFTANGIHNSVERIQRRSTSSSSSEDEKEVPKPVILPFPVISATSHGLHVYTETPINSNSKLPITEYNSPNLHIVKCDVNHSKSNISSASENDSPSESKLTPVATVLPTVIVSGHKVPSAEYFPVLDTTKTSLQEDHNFNKLSNSSEGVQRRQRRKLRQQHRRSVSDQVPTTESDQQLTSSPPRSQDIITQISLPKNTEFHAELKASVVQSSRRRHERHNRRVRDSSQEDEDGPDVNHKLVRQNMPLKLQPIDPQPLESPLPPQNSGRHKKKKRREGKVAAELSGQVNENFFE